MFDKARELAAAGDFSGAIKTCRKILKRDRNNGQALYLAGSCALQAAKYDDAVTWLQRASRVQSATPEVWNNLGAAYLNAGDPEKAKAAIGRALDLNPDYANAHVNLAAAMRTGHRFMEAADCLRRAAEISGDDATLLSDLGHVLDLAGKRTAAAAAFERALTLTPDDLQLRNRTVLAIAKTGQPDRAAEIALAEPREGPERADALFRYGETLGDNGYPRFAIRILHRALQAHREHLGARSMLDTLYSKLVPRWHFNMLNDAGRNEMYDAAIRRIVKEGDVVLDIGAGSGLLAMMAVRAGAKHVYSCEGNGLLADKAREIVAANGMSDRITVIGKLSNDLVIGEDLPQRAKILISEILDNVLIGEGVIPSLKHAFAELVTPDARVLPIGGRIFAMPVEAARLMEKTRVDNVAGFDLSAFSETGRFGYWSIKPSELDVRRLAEPEILFEFDLTRGVGAARPNSMMHAFSAARDGVFHGVAVWIELQVDAGTVLRVDPESDVSHWLPAWFVCDQPRDIAKGDKIEVRAHHDTMNLHVMID